MLSVVLSLVLSLCPAPRAELLFAGDAMQHKAQVIAAKDSSGNYDYSTCFAALDSIIKSADYAIVNLETPLAGAPYNGYPHFSAPDSYAVALKDAGFDLFLLANNHILDCRDKGLKRTTAVLDSLNIPFIGAYPNGERKRTSSPCIKDVNGFKIAFLNYTYGTNGIEIQKDVEVNYIDKKKISEDVEAARKSGAEIVCVAIHWGEEYRLIPDNFQKSTAKFLKEIGVDIILGGHPHVVQPMKLEFDSIQQKNIATVYSLGNFISNMKTTDTRGGVLCKIILKRNDRGNAVVDYLSYKLVFTVPRDKNRNFMVVDPQKSMPEEWRQFWNAFSDNAYHIFNSHNINVSEF